MSDTPAVSAKAVATDQPVGPSFEPAAAPPVALEPGFAPAVAATVAAAMHTAEGGDKPTPRPSAAVDERAYQQYQVLAETVLDSADVATRAAETAAKVGGELKQATEDFRTASATHQKLSQIIIYASGGFMVLCALIFVVMGVRMVSRINQLDTMMLAVGKRVVDLSAGLESLEDVNKAVKELNTKQVELTKAQAQIEARIDASLKQSESLVKLVPGETAKRVANASDNLLQQVQGLNGKLQSQATAVQTLSNEVKAMKGAVGNVDGLKRDVEALVTLQRERYLEALQRNNAMAARERALQYPRVSPPGARTADSETTRSQ